MSIAPSRAIAAFTLVELLTVIAIVAILAAVLIPGVSGARASANRAKTKVRFNQWAAAIEAFRSEYGFYPSFDASNLVNGGAAGSDHPFHDVIAARRRDGTPLANGTVAATQNRKRISFYTFPEGDFTRPDAAMPNLLCDAFGNTEIAVLVDRNHDGIINGADFGEALPLVGGIRPVSADFPNAGVRAGVVFYSAAPGATMDTPQFVFSWK